MKDVLSEYHLTVEQVAEKFNLFPLYPEVTP